MIEERIVDRENSTLEVHSDTEKVIIWITRNDYPQESIYLEKEDVEWLVSRLNDWLNGT